MDDEATKTHHDLEVPVVLAYQTLTPDLWAVWCAWCRKWHFHGAEEGFRHAHCGTVKMQGRKVVPHFSPYRDTGYVLKFAGPWLTTSGKKRRR